MGIRGVFHCSTLLRLTLYIVRREHAPRPPRWLEENESCPWGVLSAGRAKSYIGTTAGYPSAVPVATRSSSFHLRLVALDHVRQRCSGQRRPGNAERAKADPRPHPPQGDASLLQEYNTVLNRNIPTYYIAERGMLGRVSGSLSARAYSCTVYVTAPHAGGSHVKYYIEGDRDMIVPTLGRLRPAAAAAYADRIDVAPCT